MRKPARKDAVWFIVLLPLLVLLAEPDFLEAIKLVYASVLLSLVFIWGLNLQSWVQRLVNIRANPDAAEQAIRKDRARRIAFGRVAIFLFGLVVIIFLFAMIRIYQYVYMGLASFWLAMLVSILGLIFDLRKRDALISLGIGLGMIAFAFTFMSG